MLMLTLAISYLTTSNLPWFMDLIFQIALQYCSLQHRTLLLPPDTPTAKRCFPFGPASLFFLELFLCSSPIAYWTPTHLVGLIFRCHIFLPFHTVYETGVQKAYQGVFLGDSSDGSQEGRTRHREKLMCNVISARHLQIFRCSGAQIALQIVPNRGKEAGFCFYASASHWSRAPGRGMGLDEADPMD